MKKLVMVLALVASVSLNANGLSDDEFTELLFDCLDNENKVSCQRLIDNGLPSVEQCDKDICASVGLIYSVVENHQQAFLYYDRGCKLNNGGACFGVGFYYDEGKGAKQNKSTAKKYYGKACDLGEQMGCDNYKMLNEKGVK